MKEPVLFLILSLRHPNVPVIFERRLTAPYAVFDIQMTTLFFYSGLRVDQNHKIKKGKLIPLFYHYIMHV